MRQLLVEITAQAVELFGLAKLLGRNRLVEFRREGAIIRPARLVGAELAPPLRLARRFGIAHVGVVGHVGARRIDGFGGGIGHVIGRDLAVFGAAALHIVAIGGIAILAGFLLALILFA